MIFYIYIGTVIFSIVSLLGASYSLKKELLLIYTKEQLKQFDKKQGHTNNPITKYFAVLCPVFNILFGLIFIFSYEKIRNKAIRNIQTIMEGHSI